MSKARPIVLDAGALTAFERLDRKIVRLLELAGEVHVPAGVVAQVWRNPARQVRLVRLLQSVEISLHDLTVETAKAAGHLCCATETDDIIDASVVLLARMVGGVVVTSDPDDLRRLDPQLPIAAC